MSTMNIDHLAERPAVKRAMRALLLRLLREAGVPACQALPRAGLPAADAQPVSPAPAVEKVTRRGAKLTAPVVTPMQRGLERAGLMPHPTRGDLASPKPAVPGVVAKTAKPSGPVIVPEGVRVTVCPAGQDMRYRVDPKQPVEGGGFLAEWRARRAGGSE